MRRSQTILTSVVNKDAFCFARDKKGCFVIGAFRFRDGRNIYSSPTFIGPRETLAEKRSRQNPVTGFSYNIIVTPKVKK